MDAPTIAYYPHFHRLTYTTPWGVVEVGVVPTSASTADIVITEHDSAISAIGKTDDEVMQTAEWSAVRNRFGITTIRAIYRSVQSLYPWVKRWSGRPATRMNRNRLIFVERPV